MRHVTTDTGRARELAWLRDEKHGGEETAAFQADAARLIAGEPLDYLIGFVDFLGCHIDLSLRPLIPRAETEWWARHVTEETCKRAGGRPLRVLDLFSGSGCIGIAVAKHVENAQVVCAELESRLIGQIARNARMNGVGARVQPVEADVFAGVPQGPYDLICANPPYLSRARAAQIDDSVVHHEPHEALFAPEDGLFFLKKVLAEAPGHLAPGGTLYLECDPWQQEPLSRAAAASSVASPGGCRYAFLPDQFGRIRLLVLSMRQYTATSRLV